MTLSDLVSDIVRKLKGEPPAYVPAPARFIAPTPRPAPIPVGPQGLPLNPNETAGLVSGGSHPKGRDSGAGLVGGR